MKFVRTNLANGAQIVWDAAYVGARAISEDNKKPNGPGAPMLTMEANTFIGMQLDNKTVTRSVGVEYRIEQ